MAKVRIDSSGISEEPGMRTYDMRLTVAYMGKMKTVYIAEHIDMVETAQVYLKKTMQELSDAYESERRVTTNK